MDARHEHAVKASFEDFITTFVCFEGDRIAAKFSLPYMARGPGEVCNVFNSRSELAEYFQSYLDEYRSLGCRECRYSDLAVNWLGSECAVASVTWNLVDLSGASVSSWSESYLLTFADGRATALATGDHVGE